MRKLLAALVLTTALVSAPLAQAETLSDALISAYKTSNLLAQNEAVLRAADEDAAVALSLVLVVVAAVVVLAMGGARFSHGPFEAEGRQ